MAQRALFLLSQENLLRKAAKKIVDWPFFEYLILTTICANCVVLALEDHLPENDKAARTYYLEKTEPYFLVIFTAESVLRILSMGFVFHKG